MPRPQRITTEYVTPHYSTLVVLIGLAAAASVPGYRVGDEFVKRSYVLDDPFASMFGGYPAMVIVFGLVLQLGVDLMRLAPLRKIDTLLGTSERLALSAVRRCRARAPTELEDAHYEQLPEAPRVGAPLMSVSDCSRQALIKRVALRFTAYAQVITTGMSTGLLPITLMYAGEDTFSAVTDRICFVSALGACGLQVGAMMLAFRAEPPRVRMVAEEDLPDEDEALQVISPRPDLPIV